MIGLSRNETLETNVTRLKPIIFVFFFFFGGRLLVVERIQFSSCGLLLFCVVIGCCVFGCCVVCCVLLLFVCISLKKRFCFSKKHLRFDNEKRGKRGGGERGLRH